MAPSASLRSRISAFEALESSSNGHSKLNGGVQLPPLTVPRKPVNILDSDSTSPTADSLFTIPPIQPVPSPSRPSSPAALGRKSSLIDFSELSSPKLKPVSANGTGSTTSSTSASDSSKRPQLPPRTSPVPPLPPRKPSVTSLRTTPTTAPPLPKRHASSPISSALSKQPSSPSLLMPSDSHTYPPASPRLGASPGLQSRHMPSSSTSSFHSVSLSSDGGDTHDTHDSLDGSYEAVSSTAATSPTVSTQYDWEHDLQPTPKLPQRSWQKQAAPSPVASPASITARRPAPPPPQRRPVKSHSHSSASASASSSLPHHRPAPLPPNARKRYDSLFERNFPQNPRKGRASGWRGLSVDLLTNGEKPEFGDGTRRDAMLDGTVVKRIWSCSKLPRARLREIWMECDPGSLGSLDRDAFAKGMWRIDEELRRAQQQQPQNQTRMPPFKPMPISTSYAPRAPPPLRKPNFLLR